MQPHTDANQQLVHQRTPPAPQSICQDKKGLMPIVPTRLVNSFWIMQRQSCSQEHSSEQSEHRGSASTFQEADAQPLPKRVHEEEPVFPVQHANAAMGSSGPSLAQLQHEQALAALQAENNFLKQQFSVLRQHIFQQHMMQQQAQMNEQLAGQLMHGQGQVINQLMAGPGNPALIPQTQFYAPGIQPEPQFAAMPFQKPNSMYYAVSSIPWQQHPGHSGDCQSSRPIVPSELTRVVKEPTDTLPGQKNLR